MKQNHRCQRPADIRTAFIGGAAPVKFLTLPKGVLYGLVLGLLLMMLLFWGLIHHMRSLSHELLAHKDTIKALELNSREKEHTISDLSSMLHTYKSYLYGLVEAASDMEHQLNISLERLNADKQAVEQHLNALTVHGAVPFEQEDADRGQTADASESRDLDFMGASAVGGISFFQQIHDLRTLLHENGQRLLEHQTLYEALTDKAEAMSPFLAAYPSILPVDGRITSHMGWRRNPFRPSRQEYHTGIDLAAARGTPVLATGAGKVIYSAYYGGYGHTVILDHGKGLTTLYAHNSRLLVGSGDRVQRGDVIALAGSSGRATGPHVHYEVRLHGTPKDPITYLASSQKGE